MDGKQRCNKNHLQCSKPMGHPGRCNKEHKLEFWKKSVLQRTLQKDCSELLREKDELQSSNFDIALNLVEKKEELHQIEEKIEETKLENQKEEKELQDVKQQQHKELVKSALEFDRISRDKESVSQKVLEEKNDIKELQDTYSKLKLLINRKSSASTKRQKNPSSKQLLSSCSTTKYRRRKETKDLLEFVHGGKDAAIDGAWDFLSSNTDESKIEELVSNYRRGKFLQTLFNKKTESNDVMLKKALASKYLGHLSRRRFNLLCKIQKTSFDSNEDGDADVGELIPQNELKLDLRSKQLSHYTVDKFVKSLDIGEIHEIPSCSGVARTVTALVTMIVDVNLQVSANKDKLYWFNNVKNHFIVEFSDDGAPESKEVSMTIGTLSLWNYQNRIRSRDHHYPLHLLSTDEKNAICEDLWRQHSDEMILIEGNIFTINSEKVTFEFQPSADQSWQCWAANVLPSSATYPSPYANVHKSQLDFIGGAIGLEENATWKPPTKESTKKELEALNIYRKSLSDTLSASSFHDHELAYMAENGYRQTGEPRVGNLAERLRPEPLHLEINNWQHLLNLIYVESIRRDKFEIFCKVLESPVRCQENPGCGLKFVVKKIREHYAKEATRMNILEVRLIGAQAIALARHCHRVMDAIYVDESEAVKIKHQALSLI
ncbi:uncharacterized protein [Clytia hemisphaerica]|uniref:uncharacterized protein n=1 Tax=Clytia hemisphaerica TaxID=252671 RepID=UPI0034D4BFCB